MAGYIDFNVIILFILLIFIDWICGVTLLLDLIRIFIYLLILISACFFGIIGGKYLSLKNMYLRSNSENNQKGMLEDENIQLREKKIHNSKNLARIIGLIDLSMIIVYIIVAIELFSGNYIFGVMLSLYVDVPIFLLLLLNSIILGGRYFYFRKKLTIMKLGAAKTEESFQQASAIDAPKMKKCFNCDASIEMAAQFCDQCGAEQIRQIP